MSCVCVIDAHDTWVSQLSWLNIPTQEPIDLVLATGSVNGSVKIWTPVVSNDGVQVMVYIRLHLHYIV